MEISTKNPFKAFNHIFDISVGRESKGNIVIFPCIIQRIDIPTKVIFRFTFAFQHVVGLNFFNDFHGIAGETYDVINIVGNVFVVPISVTRYPKIRVSLAGGVTHDTVEFLSMMFMKPGSRGAKSVEAVVDHKFLAFKSPKLRTGDDVSFLSGLSIQVCRGDVSGTNFQTIHLCKQETQTDCLHTNHTSICLF